MGGPGPAGGEGERPRGDSLSLGDGLTAAGLSAAALAAYVALSAFARPSGLTHDGAYILNLAGEIHAGHGFVTPVLWNLYLGAGSLPVPYGGAGGPLVSSLIAASYAIAGESFRSAQLPGVLLGALVPGLAFLLARRFGAAPGVAWAGASLAAVHPALVHAACTIGSDLPYTAVFLGCLLAWRSAPGLASGALLGLLAGLLYLIRYQGAMLLAAIVLAGAAGGPRERRRIAGAAAGFAAAVAPWIARNVAVFAAPFHSHANAYFFMLGTHPSRIDLVRSVEPPPAQIGYVLANVPAYLAGAAARLRSLLLHGGEEVVGNLGLLAGCVAAVPAAVRRRAELALPLIYAALLTVFLLATYLELRYLMSLTPLFVLAAAAGFAGLARGASATSGARGGAGAGAVTAAIVVVIGLHMAVTSARMVRGRGTASYLGRAEAALRACDHLGGLEPWTGTIMSSAPEYVAYFCRQYAVSTPIDLARDFETAVSRHDVTHLLAQDRELDDLRASPAWGRLVPIVAAEDAHLFAVTPSRAPAAPPG